MVQIKTWTETVAVFEKYYNDWVRNKDYQLKKLLEQKYWEPSSMPGDDKLCTGAIVAIMAVLNDASISHDLHNPIKDWDIHFRMNPEAFKKETIEKIRKIVNQKMRKLYGGFQFQRAINPLYEISLNHSDLPKLPDWVKNFYYAASKILGILENF